MAAVWSINYRLNSLKLGILICSFIYSGTPREAKLFKKGKGGVKILYKCSTLVLPKCRNIENVITYITFDISYLLGYLRHTLQCTVLSVYSAMY